MIILGVVNLDQCIGKQQIKDQIDKDERDKIIEFKENRD